MNFRIVAKHFAAGLAQATAGCEARPRTDVLRCVHCAVAEGSLVLVGSSAEACVEADISKSLLGCEGGGACLLPTREIAAWLAMQGSDAIEIRDDGRKLRLKSVGSEVKLGTPSVADYPLPPVEAGGEVVEISAQTFCAAVRAVCFAVDNESSRYALAAICLSATSHGLQLAALDGRKVATVMVPLNAGAPAGGWPKEPLLPYGDALVRALRGVGDFGGDVALSSASPWLIIKAGPLLMRIKEVVGRFPDLSRATCDTTGPTRAVSLPAEVLSSAIREAEITSGEADWEAGKHYGVRLEAKGGRLIVGGVGDLGESCREIPIGGEGDNAMLRLHGRHLKPAVLAAEKISADGTVQLTLMMDQDMYGGRLKIESDARFKAIVYSYSERRKE